MKNKNKRELEKRWAEEAGKKAKAAQSKIRPKRGNLRQAPPATVATDQSSGDK